MLFDAVGKVREAAARMSDSNNLKQLGLAMHNYQSTYGMLPSPDRVTGPDAKPGLSWRVHLLPYIEQDNLYQQFKLDEPWDSENNKKLIEKMPKVYATPLAMAQPGETYYKVFTGKDAIFYPGSKTTYRRHYGRHLEHDPDRRGWPAGHLDEARRHPFDGKIDPKTLALPGQRGINICMADGSVRWTDLSTLTPAKLAAAITRAGGETISLDDPVGPGEAVPFVVPKEVPIPTKPAPPKSGQPSKPPETGKKKD